MNFKEEKRIREEQRDKRIKLEDLQHGKLYKLLARNIKIGVWHAEHQEFFGIRTKFGSRFIDGERHWDAPEFATACPLEIIGEIPSDISWKYGEAYSYALDKSLFQWLEDKEKELGIVPEECF
jgi:hypothetical protein